MKVFKELFGGGSKPKAAPAPAPMAAAPAAAGGAGAAGAVAPGTSADDYRKQQTAYNQQMLAGLGMGTPTGELPQGIADSIERQAALIK